MANPLQDLEQFRLSLDSEIDRMEGLVLRFGNLDPLEIPDELTWESVKQNLDDRTIALVELSWVVKGWLARLSRYGVTKQFVKELNTYLIETPVRMKLSFHADTTEVNWVRGHIDENDLPSPIHLLAHGIANLLALGRFRHLKRCALEDCRKFHVRRGKWCSDNCGSKYRVRKKRKKDKERQML